VLPLLHIGDIGEYSIIAGLIKADVPASWYVTPVVRAIVNIQWASFAQVSLATGHEPAEYCAWCRAVVKPLRPLPASNVGQPCLLGSLLTSHQVGLSSGERPGA